MGVGRDMNRGFFRIWVVVSALWCALILFLMTVDGWPPARNVIAVATIPPLILFALGIAVRWIFYGFTGSKAR